MKIRPDMDALDEIRDKYSGQYAGDWIEKAWDAYGDGDYEEAAFAFQKARNGFGRNSIEWQCLEAWRAHAEERASA